MSISEALVDLVNSNEKFKFHLEHILSGDASDEEISETLIALNEYGIDFHVLNALASVMNSHVDALELLSDEFIDTCGTGGSKLKIFNCSTISAFVVASCGGKVVKHGNKSITSKSGSADFLARAGVNINNDKCNAINAFNQFGISSSSGKSMAWDDVSKSGENDAEFFITFSSLGFQNINLYFDIKGNDDAGILSYDLKYDFTNLEDSNPIDVSGTVKDFASGSSLSFLNNQDLPTSISGVNAEFSRISLDFGSLLDNQNFVALRLDDFKENDSMSIDNVLITGTVIPESSTYALLLGLFAMVFALIRKHNKS